MTDMSFGVAWVGFALVVAVHVADEAAHGFLSVYNSTVRAVRARLPFLLIPTFSFPIWIGGLAAGIALLLALSPLAFAGDARLRLIAWPLAILVGLGNGLGHLVASAWKRQRMPGIYSAPLLLAAGAALLATAVR
jgi:hypothetical protein